MRIGIDIDNTICSTNMMAQELYKKQIGGSLSSLSKWQQYKFIQSCEDKVFNNCPLEDYASEVLNRLNKKHDIFLITARANKHVENIEQRTIKYLKENNITYDGIYFGHDSKIDIFKKLNLDVMLDDDYDVYEELTNNGYLAFLYSGMLNENKKGKKVKSWLDFEQIIGRINSDE